MIGAAIVVEYDIPIDPAIYPVIKANDNVSCLAMNRCVDRMVYCVGCPSSSVGPISSVGVPPEAVILKPI